MVHIGANVAFVGEQGHSRVQAHPYVDRPFAQGIPDRAGRFERALLRREGNEERIALRVDLNPASGAKCLAQDPPVLGQGFRVLSRTQLMEELRRAFDVGEEEGDPAGREIGAHGFMMHPRLWRRASAFQAECREFEPRLLLHTLPDAQRAGAS